MLECFVDLYSVKCPLTFLSDSARVVNLGMSFAGYGSICELCSVVIILVSFVVTGVLCIRRFYLGSTIATTAVGRRNSKVRRQIIITVCTVFATFLIRCLYAVALSASRTTTRIVSPFDADDLRCRIDFESKLDAGVCAPCHDLGFIVQSWLFLCPSFSFTVFLLSSPVTILIALWGMTSDNFIQSLGLKCPTCFQKKGDRDSGTKLSFFKADCEM